MKAALVLALAITACAPRLERPSPETLVKVSGDGQVATVFYYGLGASFPEPVVVRLDPPLPGATVRAWWFDRGQPVHVALTDEAGYARFSLSPFAVGPATLTVGVAGSSCDTVTFTLYGTR